MSDTLLIPQPEKFLQFYEKCVKNNNLNILIVGERETCKSTAIEYIITKFTERQKNHDKSQIVFRFNAFDEINLQNQNNNLTIFCQNNANSNKIVYIDKFDFLGESNQQQLKIYMDKYNTFKKTNKVFFILEATYPEKIRDVIKSRCAEFVMKPLESEQYKTIFTEMLASNDISTTPEILNKITNVSYLTISILKNIMTKAKLLSIKSIDANNVTQLFDFVDYDIFSKYFSLIKDNKTKDACNILLNLHSDGCDISDIYFNIYEYIKNTNQKELFGVTNHLCEYINEIYNGNYNRIMLVLFTYDIKSAIMEKINTQYINE